MDQKHINSKPKLSKKQSKIVKHLHHQKKIFVFVCMYKMLTFSIKTWSKIRVEVIKY